jgi:hypothetical protein
MRRDCAAHPGRAAIAIAYNPEASPPGAHPYCAECIRTVEAAGGKVIGEVAK